MRQGKGSAVQRQAAPARAGCGRPHLVVLGQQADEALDLAREVAHAHTWAPFGIGSRQERSRAMVRASLEGRLRLDFPAIMQQPPGAAAKIVPRRPHPPSPVLAPLRPWPACWPPHQTWLAWPIRAHTHTRIRRNTQTHTHARRTTYTTADTSQHARTTP